MVSCIAALYLLTLLPSSGRLAAQSPDPEALYRQREDIAKAKQAADIWGARAAKNNDFESWWKLARACYWIGTHGADADRRPALERGLKAAETAATLEPKKPEGYFWQAANQGALAESFGMWQGIKYRGRIKDNLQRVLAMDPAWQQGSADRALGWWYYKVPGMFGGSDEKAEQHLRKALTYNPKSTATLYFLSEVLLDRGKKSDATAMLQQVLDAPLDPDWTPEDRSFKGQAAQRLKEIKKQPASLVIS
jgi:tetratricopeptide (TPR) repeat protein